MQKRLACEHLHYVPIADTFRDAVRQVREAACDLLYYWEVGSDAMNYFLPFAQLAPVQCTSHGSLTTTGVPAVDYFFSSSLIETEGAAGHYSERLWQSRALLMCQERLPPVSPAWPGYFGLPENRRLYGCFQNPLKLHPDFDGLLAGILAADSLGTIVLLADDSGRARLRTCAGSPGTCPAWPSASSSCHGSRSPITAACCKSLTYCSILSITARAAVAMMCSPSTCRW